MTSQQYQMNLFEDSEVWTLSVEDFRAKLSALRDTDEVLKIHEELCSLKIARFASILRPKYLFLENVRGLLNHDGGSTFETIIRTLDELGYDVEWQVLNSKNFGVPQNRERVFVIGHLRGGSGRKIFPLSGDGAAIACEQPKINKVGNIRKKGNRKVVTSSQLTH